MIFSQKFKKNLFALPIIMFGSNKKILIFPTFAAKHNGKDIYPPVEIKISIFSLFNKNKDFKVKKNAVAGRGGASKTGSNDENKRIGGIHERDGESAREGTGPVETRDEDGGESSEAMRGRVDDGRSNES